jgi:ADP-ribose pyrophosphatase YjhB (NUDIX family)
MHVTFPVTVHLFLFREEQILLLRRFQTGYMDGYFSVPVGHLDGDETVRKAGVREAREEIGVRIDPGDMNFAGVFHRREDEERVDFFFHVRAWMGEPFNVEPEKCDQLLWADPNTLPKNTIPYICMAIDNYRGGKLYEEFGWGKN